MFRQRFTFGAVAVPVLAAAVSLLGSQATFFSPPVFAGDKDNVWVQLFNGKNLNGWKTTDEEPGNWRVEKGLLIGSGKGRSHLFSQRGNYANFQFMVEAKVNDKGNSGQYFRTQFGPGYPDGYEAQINSTHANAEKTGSLYGKANVAAMLVPPNTWFTQEVIANGNRIMIKVNGKTTVDFIDKEDSYSEGHFAIQQLPGTVITIKTIAVRELPRGAGSNHILWIGNSLVYYNDLPRMVTELARAGGQRPLFRQQETPGGCTLEKHWNDGEALKKLRSRKWDFVVLQEHSQHPLKNSRPMFEYAKKFDAEIRRQGGKTLLYLPFPLAKAPQNQDKLTALHEDLAAQLKAQVVPVGPAWAKALATAKPPTLFHADMAHPGKDGSYLAACVFYAALYGKSPEGLPGNIGGLSDKQARQFQAIAWQVVKDGSK